MIKITGTNSYIRVNIDENEVIINGEMIVGGFIAYKDSIKVVNPANKVITEEEKNEIIQKVSEKTKDSHMIISFK